MLCLKTGDKKFSIHTQTVIGESDLDFDAASTIGTGYSIGAFCADFSFASILCNAKPAIGKPCTITRPCFG